MPDYSKGKIYCIRSFQTDKVYVGSTVETLSSRMSKHRYCYKKFLNGKFHYISSFEILKYDDCYIELIKSCSCSSRSELLREEGRIIREIDCVNKQIAGRTKKEWNNDNQEIRAVKQKEYNKTHKEKIAVQRKEYLKNNKEKISVSSKKNYQNNKEIRKEYQKTYNENNKEKINEKFNCECGGKYTHKNKLQHFKTKLHQDYLNEKI